MKKISVVLALALCYFFFPGFTYAEEKPLIAQITLPDEFTQAGSQTTDLSKITAAEAEKCESLTLDVPGFNQITFLDAVDLSHPTTVDHFKNLDKFIQLSHIGTVSVDSDVFPVLNVPAKIEMRHLPFTFTPQILKDGKSPREGMVTNVDYQAETGTLRFNITDFSVYHTVPNFYFLNHLDDQVATSNYLLEVRVNDPQANVTFYLEKKPYPVTVNPQTGEFDLLLHLKRGENYFFLGAKDSLGEGKTQEYKIVYTSGGLFDVARMRKSVLYAVPLCGLGITLIIVALFRALHR